MTDRPTRLAALAAARGRMAVIVLGALVIVASWLLTLGYVRWANLRYDSELERLRNGS